MESESDDGPLESDSDMGIHGGHMIGVDSGTGDSSDGSGLHSSTCLAQRKHILWNTLIDASLSTAKTSQVELKHGRV